MGDITFYDLDGKPMAYTEDGEHVYLFSGEPVAYLAGDSVYNYDGKHLGFFESGLVRDHSGDVVFFSENSSGGPTKPIKQIKPIKSIKQIKPIKSVKEIRPIKSVNTLSWSSINGEHFFL